MSVSVVNKVVELGRWKIVKYQILSHCYFSGVELSTSEINCLTLLSTKKKFDLNDFCTQASNKNLNIFKSSQSVRNFISKAEKQKLIIKTGKGKKKVFINPDMKIQTEGSILLNFKIGYREGVKGETK